MEAIGVPFDGAVVAGEIGSYKPAHGHWRTFSERFDADPERHVHVAASLFHDIAPARELGIPAVWINRLGETSDLPRAAELTDLSRLPETSTRSSRPTRLRVAWGRCRDSGRAALTAAR